MPTHLESICEDHWFSPQLGPFIYFSLSEHLGFSLRRQQVWMGSQSRGWEGGLLARGGSERGDQGLLNYSADFSSNAIARGLRNPSQAPPLPLRSMMNDFAPAFFSSITALRIFFAQLSVKLSSRMYPISPFCIP